MSLEKLAEAVKIPKLYYLAVSVLIGMYWMPVVHEYLHKILVQDWNPILGKIVPTMLTLLTLSVFFLVVSLRSIFIKNPALKCPKCKHHEFRPRLLYGGDALSKGLASTSNFKQCTDCGYGEEVRY